MLFAHLFEAACDVRLMRCPVACSGFLDGVGPKAVIFFQRPPETHVVRQARGEGGLWGG